MMMISVEDVFMMSEIISSLENFSREDCWFLFSEEFVVQVVAKVDLYDEVWVDCEVFWVC